MTRHNRLTLVAPAAAITAADTDARTLTGVAIPYGEQGQTSGGMLTIDAGAVRVPDNLRTVKLFREHGRTTPLGYAMSADDTPERLTMSFHVAATPDGDQSLLEASEGLRDALSVELANVTVKDGHVTASQLVGVAQVAVPAFASAVLTAALSDDEQADVNELAQQIVDATKPAEDEPAEETPFTEEDPDMTEASAPVGMVPTAPAFHASRDDVQLAAAHIAEAMRGATDASQVNLTAALTDITPAGSGSDTAFMRPAWLGKLWEPAEKERPLINAIGVSPLTSMVIDSWHWVNKPTVAPYAGNKAAVPSSPASIAPAQATAQRIAGGWDLDRIYVDFNSGFVEAFLQAATLDYRAKTASYFLDGHAAITGPPAIPAAEGIMDDATDLGPQADLLTALGALSSFLVGNGAHMNFLGMAGDVFGEFLAIKATDVPWWLQNQGTVDLSGSTSVAGITVGVDPGLAPGAMVAGDKAAVSLWETGPINVQAVNVPNGGVDLGLFGYWAQQVHDNDGVAKAQVTVTAGTAQSEQQSTDDSSSTGKRSK